MTRPKPTTSLIHRVTTRMTISRTRIECRISIIRDLKCRGVCSPEYPQSVGQETSEQDEHTVFTSTRRAQPIGLFGSTICVVVIGNGCVCGIAWETHESIDIHSGASQQRQRNGHGSGRISTREFVGVSRQSEHFGGILRNELIVHLFGNHVSKQA